ncbi:MAG: hypothetical protein OXU51_20070 [Candidatus Poribacteria bacterium]|nr:hypothetical protein [Candidatus Poribacteria bacterium]
MKLKVLISLLLVGCVILFGFIFLIVKVKQQKEDRKQLVDEFLSRNDSPPPPIPRTEEIPDEIRRKFAAVPEIPEKPKIIAELVQGGYPETVEFSPTNPYLVVSRTSDKNSEDDIRLWDINNPVTPLAVFRGDSVSFSPDGKRLAISDLGNIDGRIKLWDIATEQFMSALRVVAFDAVFSPDNKHLALSSSSVLLWNVSNPTALVEAIELERKNIEKDHTFSADGKLMATVESRTDTVNIWEINGNQVMKKSSINVIDRKVGWIEAMQFLPDPKNPILAIVDNDEDIRLYYPPDWQSYNTIPAGNVYDLAFTPDGKTLISGGTGEVEIWSVENGNRIASIEGYSRWVKCVDVSADGKFVAAGGNDGVIRVWDIANYLPKKQEITQNIVIPIYFLPTNRPPQADIPEKIDRILRDLQTFFADEIQRHAFGRKTFDFEKNSDGSAKVYLFEGKTTDEYYDEDTRSRVLNEIEQHFELSNNCYFIIADKSTKKKSIKNRYTSADLEKIEKGIRDMTLSIRDSIFRKRQGGDIVVRTPLNGYSKHVLAAEFGDAFGLNRDYRHPSYLMSGGRQSKHLSKSSAAWLSRSRFFNTEMTFFDDKTVIETLSPSKGKIRFKVEDTDGIYQVRLLAKPINKNHPPGFQMKIDPVQNQTEWEKSYQGRYYTLHDALTLQGEKKATVELDYPKFVDDLIELHVIDSHGNRVYVIKRIDHSGTSFLRRMFN